MKIAIVGGPGVGKSTFAAGLFYYLKKSGRRVELIPELIKIKVYQELDFTSTGFDIANTLEQKAFEKIFDKAKGKEIDILIAEAPLCNGWFYSSFYQKDLEAPVLKAIALEALPTYDKILVVRPVAGADYQTFGRKETSQQSLALSAHIERTILSTGVSERVIFVTMLTTIEDILDQLSF